MTLADLRLAALRVVVGAVPLAILAGVLGGPGRTERAVAAAVAFALWGIGPPTLAERAAARRGGSPAGVGLAAGAAAAVGVPAALAHVLVIGGGGPGPGLPAGAVGLDDLVFCALLGVWAGVPVAGVTFVHVSPMVRGRAATAAERWLFEPFLAISALFAGIPLLAVYAIADALELLLVGPGPALARKAEALPETRPEGDR